MQEGFGTVVKIRRRSISLTAFYSGLQTKSSSPGRSSISGWNDGMSRRIGNYLDNFREDFTGMVTLTYPGKYPKDGRLVKAHWRAFIERLRRTGYFSEGSLVWFLEFQERGAPHFHFLTTAWIRKNWVAENWAQISGGNESACSRVEALKDPNKAGAYARKYASKNEQKQVPADYLNIGRMWGCCGERILHGLPKVPVVVADIKGALPSSLRNILNECKRLYEFRLAETESGFVLYGNTTQIKQARIWLCRNVVITNRTGNTPVASMHGQLDALRDTPRKLEKAIMRSASSLANRRNSGAASVTA